MPLIAVAPTPGGQNNAQCTMHNAQSTANSQQSIVNSQPVLTPSSSGIPPKSGGEYVGLQTIANSQSNATQDNKPVVVGAPIVVQKPKVVSVSLNTTSVKVDSNSLEIEEKSEVKDVVSVESNVQKVSQSDFTNDDLIRAWRLYAKKIEGELHTFNTMQNFLPEKGIGASVVVRLINTMQFESLSKHKRTLEQFLVKELNNSSIVVDFVVEEQVNQPVFLTKDENFKRMQEINLDFKRLKTELGLEIV